MRHHRSHSIHDHHDADHVHPRSHAMGRHGGGGENCHGRGGGFSRFGDGDGYTRGRKFSSDDLQLLLLALLIDKPAHGYELIRAIEARSNGFYTPSPGMVYPALTYLEEINHVTVTLEGNRKSYTLATAGREYLATNQGRVDFMLAKLANIATRMDSVRRAYSGDAGSDSDDGNNGWETELIAARHAIRATLHQFSNTPAELQRRATTVLQEATQKMLEILKDRK
jgi:DNA-binding PadR family transcriptional regulator